MIIDRSKVLPVVAAALREGATLRDAARRAGVHVASLYRWQRADPEIRDLLRKARQSGRPRPARSPRPQVRWRKDCPDCRARVVVRTTGKGQLFWRCGRWPDCAWASWRPRYPRDCPRCRAPRFWSHTRRSIGCDDCGLRTNPR